MEIAEKPDNLAAGLDIEVPGGFVAEKDCGTVEERSRKSDPLPLAARQSRRVPAARTGQTNSRKNLVRALAHPRCIAPYLPAGEERGNGNILTAGQVIEEMVCLKNVADHPVTKFGELDICKRTEVFSVYRDSSVIGGVETTDEIEQSSLAGAGPADNRNEVMGIDGQIDAA